MVFYRKYRPQKIDDLDSETIRKTLFSVLKNPTTHAFLFTGPKGLGKTSTARIIAKVVNCEKKEKDTIEPCNACMQCQSVTDGSNLDVIEIDAASNRGIDEIRDLKEKIRLAPVAAKKKIYIIDEVHMLTTEAFNALLKTLEEPPAHAMFILCTTEPHKVPATIISRCFHLTFSPATKEELIRSFKRIVEGEQIVISDEALSAIADISERGFRDGAKILEEIVALSDGKKITKELLEEKYKLSHTSELVNKLLQFLKSKEIKESLEVIQQITAQGIDPKYFIQQLMETLHGLMLIRIKSNDQPTPSQFTLEEIKILFELLAKASIDTKYAVLPQLPLELAIIEYCEMSEQVSIAKTQVDVTGDTDEVTVASLRKKVGDIKKNQALYGEKKEKKEKVEVKTATVEPAHAAPNGEVTTEWLNHFWQELIGEMKKYNHTIAGVLRGCKIASFDKKTLTIQTNYKFHKERLDDLKTREALLQVAKLLTGKDVDVVVELRK